MLDLTDPQKEICMDGDPTPLREKILDLEDWSVYRLIGRSDDFNTSRIHAFHKPCNAGISYCKECNLRACLHCYTTDIHEDVLNLLWLTGGGIRWACDKHNPSYDGWESELRSFEKGPVAQKMNWTR